MVGLPPEQYLHRIVDRSLSGGERKRIELASVAALTPELAILDEPDSGIDMLSLQDIINVIRQGITEGKAAGARGHVDCMEIIKDSAIARAIPMVAVSRIHSLK